MRDWTKSEEEEQRHITDTTKTPDTFQKTVKGEMMLLENTEAFIKHRYKVEGLDYNAKYGPMEGSKGSILADAAE